MAFDYGNYPNMNVVALFLFTGNQVADIVLAIFLVLVLADREDLRKTLSRKPKNPFK
jgi:hypothetical protein